MAAEEYQSIISSFKTQRMWFGSVNNAPYLKPGTQRWHPSPALIALPYMWARKNPNNRHHFGDVIRVNEIIAHALGYDSWVEYIRTRGWTCKYHPKKKEYTLQYRRLEHCLSRDQSRGKSGQKVLYTLHLHEMLKKLYERLELEETKCHFDKVQPLKYLRFDSMIEKINAHAQDLHIALIIAENFFLPYAEGEDASVERLINLLYKDCKTPTQTTLFSNAILSLLPMEDNDRDCGRFQKLLLTEKRTCIHDTVIGRWEAMEADDVYHNAVNKLLSARVHSRKVTDSRREIAIIRARARDKCIPIRQRQNPSKAPVESPTQKRRNKATSVKKRKRNGA